MSFFSVDLYLWGHPLGHLSLSCPISPQLLPLVFNVSQNYSHMLIQLRKATAKCSSSRQFWIREFICPRGWRKEKNYSVTFVLWWQKGDTIFFLFSSNWNYPDTFLAGSWRPQRSPDPRGFSPPWVCFSQVKAVQKRGLLTLFHVCGCMWYVCVHIEYPGNSTKMPQNISYMCLSFRTEAVVKSRKGRQRLSPEQKIACTFSIHIDEIIP